MGIVFLDFIIVYKYKKEFYSASQIQNQISSISKPPISKFYLLSIQFFNLRI
jgi:hypothetical protein